VCIELVTVRAQREREEEDPVALATKVQSTGALEARSGSGTERSELREQAAALAPSRESDLGLTPTWR
jgi:hypothetical protein